MPPGTTSKPWPHHGHQLDQDKEPKVGRITRMKNKIKSKRFHKTSPNLSPPLEDDEEDTEVTQANPTNQLRKYDPRRLKRGVNEGSAPAGYLYLWVGNFRRWQRRFFIAHTPGVLVFYKRSHCKGPNWTINLRDANVLVTDGHPRQFVIVSGSILYYIRTILPMFRNPWVGCIRKSIETIEAAVAKASGLKGSPETPISAAAVSPLAGASAEPRLPQSAEAFKTKTVNTKLHEALQQVKGKQEAFVGEVGKIQQSLLVLTNALGLDSQSNFGPQSTPPSPAGAASPVVEIPGGSPLTSVLGKAWQDLQGEYTNILQELITKNLELEIENDGLHNIIKAQVKHKKRSSLDKDTIEASARAAMTHSKLHAAELTDGDSDTSSDDSTIDTKSMSRSMSNLIDKSVILSEGGDEEYFEALELIHQHEYIVQSAPQCESPVGAPPDQNFEEKPAPAPEEDEEEDSDAKDSDEEEEEEVFKPRARLPAPAPLNQGIDLWFIVKQALGRDLNSITLPVVPFFEPLGLLQRGAEELEYIHMLHTALRRPSSLDRLMHITMFVLSGYPAGQVRIKKPFNSLQGETFEWTDNQHCKLIIEQVSHYPPISAFDCESLDPKCPYHLYGETEFKNKFWGKTAEIVPLGCFHLAVPQHSEHYSWNKVKIKLSNIILGNPWSDISGDITVRNHMTGEVAKITIVKARNKDTVGDIKGVIYDAQHNPVYHVSGNHMTGVYVDLDATAQGMHPAPPQRLMFKPTPMPPDCERQYMMTRHALQLNEYIPHYMETLPPTDSRWRPDQRMLEEGQFAEATPEKLRLERKELAEMKMLKQSGQKHRPPLWFDRQTSVCTDSPYFTVKPFNALKNDTDVVFRFNHKYWEAKEKAAWEECHGIFD